jgi:hypothetical protein
VLREGARSDGVADDGNGRFRELWQGDEEVVVVLMLLDLA